MLLCLQNPAADIAASVAAALAISAKVARDYGTAEDVAAADGWEMLAERAFNYAKKMTHMHADEATCTVSSAGTNCVGSGCSTSGMEEGTDSNVRGVRHLRKFKPSFYIHKKLKSRTTSDFWMNSVLLNHRK